MMRSFTGKLAVVTGGGGGMGRELVVQLAREGCSVATCDLDRDRAEETARIARDGAPAGTTVTAHRADMTDESSVAAFRAGVELRHSTDHVEFVFNNAGVAGVGSFLIDDRTAWERVFDICWRGVYLGCREFLPLLLASEEGCLVNTSTIAAFWSRNSAGSPMTSYAAAKGAVKSFTEALMEDLRTNAPHVDAVLVMPGMTRTDIGRNSLAAVGAPLSSGGWDVAAHLRGGYVPVARVPADDHDRIVREIDETCLALGYRTLPAEAAAQILDGVRQRRWRIITGEDGARLDRLVRADPDGAYDPRMAMTPPWIGALCVLRLLHETAGRQAPDGDYALRVDDDAAIGIRVAAGEIGFARAVPTAADATVTIGADALHDLVEGTRGLRDLEPGELEIVGDRARASVLLSAAAIGGDGGS